MVSAAPTDCRLSHALGFDFIGSGSPVPNPADLLSSTRPSELLRLLAGSYDQIVVDTPPVRDVADAALWVSHGGSAIVLSRFARTSTIPPSDALAGPAPCRSPPRRSRRDRFSMTQTKRTRRAWLPMR